MIRHIFFNKCNTIINGSEMNTGMNPVAELNVGSTVSRILVGFDISDLIESVKNDNINPINTSYVLKMTNCGSINLQTFDNEITTNCLTKKRASSFDVIAFKLPSQWDCGRGFDYNSGFIYDEHKICSTDGCTWYKSSNGNEWLENGVYSYDTLIEALNSYKNNEESLIVGVQHFEYGTENLEIDITNYIKNVLLNNEEFYGIGLAFSPIYESESIENRFISFFTHKTNTFFLPYLEINDNHSVFDNRTNFYLNTTNKLYLFVNDNGEYINLDKLPLCTIDGKNYEVKHDGKGCYYIEIFLSKNDVEPYTILSDIWTDIYINGEKFDDIEMEFVALPYDKKLTIGKPKNDEKQCSPQLYGINEHEKLKIGDVREVYVDFIEEYSYGKKIFPNKSEYRIYVKENNREIDIFPYQLVERRNDVNSFLINTNDLVPNVYFVDVKITNGRTVKIFENALSFTVVSNITKYNK